jgi:hypothetical protein
MSISKFRPMERNLEPHRPSPDPMFLGFCGRVKSLFRCFTVTMLAAGLLAAQTAVDLRTQSKNVDFSGASSTKPMKTGVSLPATCSAGELFFLSNATPGFNVYGCTAANTWTVQTQSAGLGTVSSVGLSLPDIFSVSGAPVISSGTLTGALASQSANRVFSAPNGSSGTPSFRALVAADIPSLNYEPANANIQSHIASRSNPHVVTKSQIGQASNPR